MQRFLTTISHLYMVGSYTPKSTSMTGLNRGKAFVDEAIAEGVLKKDFSPSQNISPSITENTNTKKSAGLGPLISIYQDDTHPDHVASNLKITQENTVTNQLDDFLFSVTRVTKCLFRKDYDMYRRWKRISDIVMVVLHEKYFGWEEKSSKKKNSVKETFELYKKLNDDEKELL